MEQQEQRTLYIGLIIALALYSLSFVAPFLLSGQKGQWTSFALTLISLVFLVIWFIAVRRGYRIGTQSRQQKRHKRAPARRPR